MGKIYIFEKEYKEIKLNNKNLEDHEVLQAYFNMPELFSQKNLDSKIFA